MSNDDMVNHPSHYNSGKIEVIEAIEDWKLNYHRGSVVKYTARAGKKDPAKEIEDLEKAEWYIKRELEKLRAAKENRNAVRPNDMDKQIPFEFKKEENPVPLRGLLPGFWVNRYDTTTDTYSLVFEPTDQAWAAKNIKISQHAELEVDI